MGKTIVYLLTILFILIINPAMALTLSDGQSHSIGTYYHSGLDLDPANDIIPGTHVNLIDGGEFFGGIYLYHHATININDGIVNAFVYAQGESIVTMTDGLIRGYSSATSNSTVNIFGGYTEHFFLNSNANLFMSGGSLGGLRCAANSTGTVSGGSIGRDLTVSENGIIYLYGTDFEVNGQTLSYGDHLSDFVPLTYLGETHYEKTGIITGTLADGTALNNTFSILYLNGIEVPADIIIIPEPATLTLLGLGGLWVHKRRR